MDPKLAKQMLEQLLDAVSTQDVDEILKQQNFSDDDWKAYGRRETNWDISSNQQASAIGALTELITNSIDAVLCKKAYLNGLNDLRSEQAPKSMQEAVRKYYNVTEGKLSHLDSRQLRNLANESIIIGVKRVKRQHPYPTVTVIDFGEGQTPENFERTFLSLSEANKDGIAFVQGKFNMGSTGSIRYCTQSNIRLGHYKLIASKRFNSDRWGWSLIKMFEVQKGQSKPVVKYLCPNSQIPSFHHETLSALSDDTIGIVKQGSIVKLFEYDVGREARAVNFGLNDALTLNLIDCALPIRIFDFSAKKIKEKGRLRARGIDEQTFSGLSVILNQALIDPANADPHLNDQKPEKRTTEFRHLVSDISTEELGKIKIIAYGTSELPEFLTRTRKRIFFTINGQTHRAFNAGFLTRPSLGLSDLQEHLIIDVQCENMDKTSLNSVFMGNREQMSDNTLSRALQDIVISELKKDSKLREYKKIIALRRWTKPIEENELGKKMLNEIIKKEPKIRELLGFGNIASSTKQTKGGSEIWTQGRQFPTYLKPKNAIEEDGNYVKELPKKFSTSN